MFRRELLFLPIDGGERLYQYTGDLGRVVLDPRWHQAALRFVQLGFTHILDGMDHLLFLLCLVIPFQRLRVLVILVTAFTVAHSITLIAGVAGPGARCTVVCPARRNGDRRLHRLHGAGEHRGTRPAVADGWPCSDSDSCTDSVSPMRFGRCFPLAEITL